MTMGNAVRLAKNTDRNKKFSVPWAGRLDTTMKHATISGKKIQLNDKVETPHVQTADAPEKISNVSNISVDLPGPGKQGTEFFFSAKQNNLLNQRKDTNVATNLVEGSGQQTGSKSDIEKLISQTKQNIISSGHDSPRTEVRYIVLQPGQKVTDFNLLPVRTSLELGQGVGQPNQPRVLYLNQLNKGYPVSLIPASPPTSSPISKVHSDMKNSSVSGSAASCPSLLPSLSPSEPIKSESLDTDRAKDVVPGTDDKYRTPGSSFRNKNGNIKRPMNAFMVWARNYRSKLASHFQSDTNSQISIKLGDIWNSLSHEEKQPFYDEAERIKNQHKKEFPGWVYRPTPPKRRHEDSATHHLLWARFSGGPSSATLAAMATAAANQAPLDCVPVKQEALQSHLVAIKQEGSAGQAAETGVKTEQRSEQTASQTAPGVQTAPQVGSGEQSEQTVASAEQQQPPKPATLKVLKAKLCGDGVKGLKIVTPDKTEKSSPRKSQSKTPRCGSKPHTSPEQKGSGKPHKDRQPRVMGKKKKQGQLNMPPLGIERREDDKYMLDLRSTSPVTPPSTPRSVCVVSPTRSRERPTEKTPGEDPVAAVAMVNRPETNGSSAFTGFEHQIENFPWSKPSSVVDDTLTFPLPPHQYGPFDHLSPRDVPSDEILGLGRLARESNEDLTRPERVTSDMYLNVHGWKSFLSSSESTSKLTDDDVCNIFNPKSCEHGPQCQVCSSDLDLAPKPVQETLHTRATLINSAYGDPNVCLEVRTDAFKQGEANTKVDQITGSVYEVLLAQGDSQCTKDTLVKDKAICGPTTVDDSHGVSSAEDGTGNSLKEDGRLVRQDTEYTKGIAVKDESTVSKLGTEVCVEDDASSDKDEVENKGVRFVDISLSAHKTTHVVFKGVPDMPEDSDNAVGGNGSTDGLCENSNTCIGCSLNVSDFESLAKIRAEMDQFAVSSMSDTDASSESTDTFPRNAKVRTGAPSVRKPMSVYRTDESMRKADQDRSPSKLAPEVIPLTPLRSSDSESPNRCDMYHRKIELQTDISKYKLFDTNRSARPTRSARLKSAQLTRDGQSMKLGVFDEERNRKGFSLSTGNMDSRSRLQIDDIEGVAGTCISIGTREDVTKTSRKSTENRRVAFAVDEGRRTRGKKKSSKKSAAREPEENESELCHGDSAVNKSESASPYTEKMKLLRTLLRKEKRGAKSSMDGGCFDMTDSNNWNTRQNSRTRSQITSKIYVSRQALPDPPRRKNPGSGMRSSNLKQR